MCSQWKLTADAANSVTWVASSLRQGSGKAAEVANNTALVQNTTPGAVVSAGVKQSLVVGQFPFTPAAYANGTGESKKVVGGTGWVLRKEFEGPITTLAVANGQFVNGETVKISGGTVNAIASLTTNATGNLVSASIVTNGLFPNTSVLSATFTHERHLVNLSVTGSDTGLGNANTGYIVVSNTNQIAVANVPFTSNSTGGLINTGISVATATVGLFPTNQTNVGLVVAAFWANGLAANVTGLTFVANVSPSTGGAITIGSTKLGGRAGRVTYETLVSTRFIANGALANSTSSAAQLPQ